MGLVNPLLAAGGGVDEVVVADAEDGEVFLFEVLGDAVDVGELTIKVFELVEHLLVPEAFFLEVVDELAVEDDEVAAEVAFDEEVFVAGLNARGGAHDVGDGRSRGDGEDVGVAHAVLGDFVADDAPVHFAAAGDVDVLATLFLEEVEGVLGEEAAVPLGTFVALVGATLASEVAGATVGVVGDGFHEFVVEVDGLLGGEGVAFFVEGIL